MLLGLLSRPLSKSLDNYLYICLYLFPYKMTLGIFMYKSRIILRAESYLLRAESYVLRAESKKNLLLVHKILLLVNKILLLRLFCSYT